MLAFLRNLVRREPKMPAPTKLPTLVVGVGSMARQRAPSRCVITSYHPPLTARPRPVTPFRSSEAARDLDKDTP
jgi:hypothetical protein